LVQVGHLVAEPAATVILLALPQSRVVVEQVALVLVRQVEMQAPQQVEQVVVIPVMVVATAEQAVAMFMLRVMSAVKAAAVAEPGATLAQVAQAEMDITHHQLVQVVQAQVVQVVVQAQVLDFTVMAMVQEQEPAVVELVYLDKVAMEPAVLVQ